MNSSRLFPRALFLALVLTSAVSPVQAAVATDERIARLEEQLAQLETRLAGMARADELAPTRQELSELTRSLGWDRASSSTLVRAAGKEKSLAIGGFIHAQGEFGGTPDSRYAGIYNRVLLRRARLNVKG